MSEICSTPIGVVLLAFVPSGFVDPKLSKGSLASIELSRFVGVLFELGSIATVVIESALFLFAFSAPIWGRGGGGGDGG